MRTEIFTADLAPSRNVRAMYDAVFDAFGRLDVVVNNAGRIRKLPLAEVPEDEFEFVWLHFRPDGEERGQFAPEDFDVLSHNHVAQLRIAAAEHPNDHELVRLVRRLRSVGRYDGKLRVYTADYAKYCERTTPCANFKLSTTSPAEAARSPVAAAQRATSCSPSAFGNTKTEKKRREVSDARQRTAGHQP